jgi:hypothetical protein
VSSRGPRFRENGRLAQLARAPRLHRGGRWFKSITAHIHDSLLTGSVAFVR